MTICIDPGAVRRMSDAAFDNFLNALSRADEALRAEAVTSLVLSGQIPSPQARALRSLLR